MHRLRYTILAVSLVFSAALTGQVAEVPEGLGGGCELILPEGPDDTVFRGMVLTGKGWEGQRIPIEIDWRDEHTVERIFQAVWEINSQTNVCLVPRTTEADYVTFARSTGGVSSSSLGRKGGKQYIQLGATKVGIILHEIGHAVGLAHEHQRPDRDEFIEIHLENVDQRFLQNFDRLPAMTPYQVVGGYDYKSISHYPAWAFSANGRPTIVPLEPGVTITEPRYLSQGDIAAINQLNPDSLGDCREVIRSYPPIVVSVTDTSDWRRCTNARIHLKTPLIFLPETAVRWEFPGGSPRVSHFPDPTVSYSRPGVYEVFLEVNEAGKVRRFRREIRIGEPGLGLAVHPNPTDGLVEVVLSGRSAEGRVDLEIFSLAGQRVYWERPDLGLDCFARRSLDLSQLPTGMYFVRLRSDETHLLTKLLIR